MTKIYLIKITVCDDLKTIISKYQAAPTTKSDLLKKKYPRHYIFNALGQERFYG